MTWGHNSTSAQYVKSNIVRFKISNLSDTLPPSIKLMTPRIIVDMIYQTDKEEMVLIGEVSDKSGVKFVTVNTDVKTINEGGIFSSNRNFSPGENRVLLIAADQEDNILEQYITIEYIPPKPTLADRILMEARYYGLIIGIDKYEDSNLPDLDNPINDAERLFKPMTSKYTFTNSDMVLLRNAKRNEIVYALDNLASKVTPNDYVMIFCAGHGTWDEKGDFIFLKKK
jgi:hypothetical protein